MMPKTIQVRDVPHDVHHRLTVRAAEQRMSLSELVRAELVEMARRPTMAEMPLVRHRHAALRKRVWALRDRCSQYDACYVALAELLDARLLTADVRLSRAATGLVPVTTPE